MLINRKLLITLGLSSIIAMVSLTSMAPDEGLKDIDVLPKKITEKQLHQVMREWASSLGVHCDFCHAASTSGKGLDFASNAKPEKETARHMFKMMGKINQKFFEAKKDSLGMIMTTGVNCYTCHRGNAHPEITVPEAHGPGGPPPGAPGTFGPGGPPPPPGGGPQGNH